MARQSIGKPTLAAALLVLALSAEHAAAQAADPSAECAAYTLPIITSNSASFPGVGTQAKILPNDSVAKAKWDEISGKVVQSSQKPAGAKPTGYDASDPDCWWTFNQCTTPKAQGIAPDVVMVPPPSTIGFGFDDGPYCAHDAFYDFLKSQNQTATMFFIGSNVFTWPREAQRALADGHELCTHTWSHPYSRTFSRNFITLYVQAMKLITGVTTKCFRPPYGDIDDRVRSIAGGLGLRTILWSYDSEDADVGIPGITEQSVDTSYNNFIEMAKNGTFANAGTILLQHEVNKFTVTKAMEYYPKLKEAIQHIVPVSVALNITQPYVETNFTLPSFDQYIAGVRVGGAAPTATSATSPTTSEPSSASATQGSNLSNAGFTTTGMTPFMITLSCTILSATVFLSVY
ncbi:hypothetical protein V5O48_008947 [Marasmius crinis-equi]|uniref:chitin deacetylase n=1 Tax=Marasmius crinis-equi TaxID=585013 RepID=A0ABR3FCH6_9AGAR